MVPADIADASMDVSNIPSQGPSNGAELKLHPLCFFLLAVVAGLVFLFASQRFFPVFRIPDELQVMFPTREQGIAQKAAGKTATALNVIVSLGGLGFVLSGLLGLGEAAARRFKGRILARLLLGVLLGTTVGCLSGLVGQPLLERLKPIDALVPIARTTLAYAFTLAIFGLGQGAAVGLVAGGGRRLLTYMGAGAMSGILAGLVFPVLCAFVMYGAETEAATVPERLIGDHRESWGLVLWLALIVAAIGIIIPLVTRRKAHAASLTQNASA